MNNLLITGVSGFLGWNVCHAAKNDWNVIGTYFSHKVRIPGCGLICVDLTSFKEVRQVFETFEVEAVIHTAAMSQPNLCQKNPMIAEKINVRASQNLCRLCSDKQIPLMFTSTDLVFDGKKAPYKEDAPVSPISIYGEQKVEAESYIMRTFPEAIICRMPLMFGDGSPVSNSFLHPLLQSLKYNEEVTLFFDEFRTPTSGISAALGLLMMLKKNTHGIIHLGGREKKSRYEFGLDLARYCGFSSSLIKSISSDSIKMEAPRPNDVSLNSSHAFKLGYAPLTIRQEFDRIVSVKRAVRAPQ